MKQVLQIVQFDFVSRVFELGGALARWWINELRLSVPASIRSKFVRQRDEFFIRIQDDAVEAKRNSGPTAAQWSALLAEGPHPKPGTGPVVFILPAQIVLRRNVDLPLAAASSLHETTSFQINRLTPFRADEVCHVARPLRRNRKNNTISAEIAIIRRASFEGMLATLEAHGFQPSAVLVEGDDVQPRIDFAPRYGPRLKRNVRTGSKFAVVAGLALVSASPLVAAHQMHVTAGALAEELINAAKVAKTASAAQTQLDNLVSTETFLPERMRGPQAIEMLDAISRLTPDSTWIFRLEIRSTEVTLQGFSTDVPTLLQRLGSSPFTSPEMVSPVVQGRTGGPSRFELHAQYKVKP